jgi:hypothetical protein
MLMSSFNLKKAVRNNPIYARITKPAWKDRFYQVCSEIGIRDMTPTAERFAEAVYEFQSTQSGLARDGMLGPKTWAKLEPRTRFTLAAPDLPDWISEMPYGWQPDVPDLPAAPEKNGITDIIDEMIESDPNYATTITNTGVTVASVTLGLKRFGTKGSVGGALVQPLVWLHQGNAGDLGDKMLYGLGLFPLLTVPAGIVSIWKGILDDRVLDQLEEVCRDEPSHLRKAIFPSATYTFDGKPYTGALKVAADGGVAWQHPNGLWVFLKLEKDGKDVLVCDYRPKNAVRIIGPELPLRPVGNRFVYRSFLGGFGE